MVEQYLEHSRQILTSEKSGFKLGSKDSGLISLFGYQNEYDLRKGLPLLTTKKMPINWVIHELIWFLRGETNIKYLEDNKVSIWRPDVFQYNLPKMVKEGIFPEGIVKYTPEWDAAMEEFGQRIRENPEFAQRFGDAGPIYGAQWRHWKHFDEEKGQLVEIDQLKRVIEKMKKKPFGKKYVVSAWNPGDLPRMSLPACHFAYQFNVNEEKGDLLLDLKFEQRSCDQFLGVPFNIASYSIFTQIIAQELGLAPRRLIHSFGDSHFYTGLEKRSQWYKNNLNELKEKVRNVSRREDYLEVLEWVNKNAPSDEEEEQHDHVTAILEQLSREPYPLPKLHIARKSFDELTIDDFAIEGYKHHPQIKRSMAV